MNTAQRNLAEYEEDFAPPGWKQQVAERLAAHRSKRSQGIPSAREAPAPQAAEAEPAAPPDASASRSHRIAAAVAERYAHSASYRNFLAAEADNAVRQAEAAAEVAARSAHAIAVAQMQLLDELAQYDTPAAPPRPVAFTVRPFAETVLPPVPSAVTMQPAPSPNAVVADPLEAIEEARALDEEIAFRQDPSFELAHPSIPIPGNLIEFPRQLVASRKARPRYAEGPLAAEPDAAQESQLRIFEVEPTQIDAEPAAEPSAPEWSSLWLDALDAPLPIEEPIDLPVLAHRPQTASWRRRVLSGAVDAGLVAVSCAAAGCVFRLIVHRLPGPSIAAIAITGAVTAFFLIYQTLFFTFSEATPGMRLARIGLCTLTDENPTRAAMRRRTFAILLAAVPLGIGLLWALLDDERLGWHDHLSRMYQRSY